MTLIDEEMKGKLKCYKFNDKKTQTIYQSYHSFGVSRK
jgi:hypothetical protein